MTAYTLGDICSRLSSGKGISAASISDSGSYPVMGGNGLRGYAETYNFEGDCTVIGRQGAACGNVRYFSGKAYMTEHAVVAVANGEHDTHYLAYLLSTMDLGRLSAQSAQPGLSVKTLAKQIVVLPPLDIQRRVATLLDKLDAKIALNAKANDYLIELVRAEFDYRYGTDTPTVDLNDVLTISTKSLNPSLCTGETWEHFSIPAFDEGHKPVFEPADGIKSNKYAIDNDCILISKLNPSTKRLWLPYCTSNRPVCSTEFIVYKPKVTAHKSFYYAAIDSLSFTDFLLAHVTGSTGSRQRTQPKATLKYPMPQPDVSEIEDFCAYADPLIKQWQVNEQESVQLEQLRDALLPKLMSGEIDVSGVELPTLPNNHLCDYSG